ncbi:hypothetical protein [Haloarchaeobius sp. HME9146]|uniref:hypothetical protein n=1 Tax=Haloarchaeobius sp. HME9146 TaxID=2978732 RepID=UPI0021C100CA|nr:hypothetical protein [Haloarchaeobius sp. HME9146]MCT9095267.1 hypothetical protein [Haloarchaeobius sp. HME9146]
MPRMESDETTIKRISIRVPVDLLDEYDEALDARDTNRSEEMRAHMRRVANDDTPERGRIPPTDDDLLARGYKALVEVSGRGGIPLDQAKSAVAQKTGISSEHVGHRIITPLRERGYLKRAGDPIYRQWVVVR